MLLCGISSLHSSCHGVSCCVNSGTYKLVFGSGIRLNVVTSESTYTGFKIFFRIQHPESDPLFLDPERVQSSQIFNRGDLILSSHTSAVSVSLSVTFFKRHRGITAGGWKTRISKFGDSSYCSVSWILICCFRPSHSYYSKMFWCAAKMFLLPWNIDMTSCLFSICGSMITRFLRLKEKFLNVLSGHIFW